MRLMSIRDDFGISLMSPMLGRFESIRLLFHAFVDDLQLVGKPEPHVVILNLLLELF